MFFGWLEFQLMHLFLEIEHYFLFHVSIVPFEKLDALGWLKRVWLVIVQMWHGFYIVPELRPIKRMRKEAFFLMFYVKYSWKLGKGHRDKSKRVQQQNIVLNSCRNNLVSFQ